MASKSGTMRWNVKEECIPRFINDNYFLSNFYPSPLKYEGILYPNVECAFQAAKTLDQETRRLMSYTINPSVSKQDGRALKLRKDWEAVKYEIMETLVYRKFKIGVLRRALLSTDDLVLIEGNNWGDRIWGTNMQGHGKNWLGIILMDVRNRYREEK